MGKEEESALRKRLFKSGKPQMRRFDHTQDMWLLWASYDTGGFEWIERGLAAKEFTLRVMSYMALFDALWLMEDDCKYFKAKRGPTCIIGIKTDGWQIQPHFEFFRWATKRMVLRCLVQFFQKSRHDKSVGVVVGRTIKKYLGNLTHLRRYGVLYYAGKIPSGSPLGDEYLFTIKGARVLTEQEVAKCHG